MSTKIHPRATTTPLIRKQIQESNLSFKKLARKYNISESTVQKWKKSNHIYDKKAGAPSCSKHITKEQEAAIVAFRIHTRNSLDECYVSFKKDIPKLSLSALYRVFKRHGVNKLPNPQKSLKTKKKFKPYPPGYVHVDITQAYTEEGKIYLFVGIDRTTKFSFVKIYKDQTAATAVAFLREMYKGFPNRIRIILTDNGLQFTHHKKCKQKHIFDQACEDLDIEHRLTKPYHPWTNGQVERMNRTLKEATIKKFYYNTHDNLKKHLQVFVDHYNYATCLKSIGRISPYEKVCLYLQSEEGKDWISTKYKFPKDYTYRGSIVCIEFVHVLFWQELVSLPFHFLLL